MSSNEVFSGDPVDRHIRMLLRNWARSISPPADGRAKLFEALCEKPWDHNIVKMSLMLLLRTVTFEILSPPIVPAVQPVLYSSGKNEPDTLLLSNESAALTAQMLSQISSSMGAGVFSLIA